MILSDKTYVLVLVLVLVWCLDHSNIITWEALMLLQYWFGYFHIRWSVKIYLTGLRHPSRRVF